MRIDQLTSSLIACLMPLALGCKMNSAKLASLDDNGSGVVVDVANVKRPMPIKPFGINFNYLRDNDQSRSGARPIVDALRELGTHYYRYPGGEKSDYHLWSTPPYDKPRPQVLGWYKSEARVLLDFDQFMGYVQQVQGEPYIVVAYDTQARTGKSKQEFLDSAVAWVKYANKTKSYGIKYWEVGNENWNNGTATASEMAVIVSEFSRAMKAVDPTILIGSSGNHGYFPDLLKGAAKDLDFVVVSNYPGLSSYDAYAGTDHPTLDWVAETAADIDQNAASTDAQRIGIVVAEFNTLDWSHKWENANDVGHALANFEIFGHLLLQPRMTFGMFWNTRWMEGRSNLNNALDDDNKLTIQGQVIAIWGQFLLDTMVGSNDVKGVSSYATFSSAQNRAVAFLVNKSSSARTVEVRFKNLTPAPTTAEVWQFNGQSVTNTNPTYTKQSNIGFNSGAASVTLPPLSITAMDTVGTGVSSGTGGAVASGTGGSPSSAPTTASGPYGGTTSGTSSSLQPVPSPVQAQAPYPAPNITTSGPYRYFPPNAQPSSLALSDAQATPTPSPTPPPPSCGASGCDEVCTYNKGDVWRYQGKAPCFRWCPEGTPMQNRLSAWGWLAAEGKRCVFRGMPDAALRLR